jgi:hypothetical protein
MSKRITGALIGIALLCPASAGAWPTWGNLESGDCAFAAAANWEMLHGGSMATDAQVLAEYRAAAPEDDGFSGDQLVYYWRTHGIAGRRASMRTADPERVRRVMHRHGAVIVQLAVAPGQRWTRLAGEVDAVLDQGASVVDVAGGLHFAVVRYINRRGPVLLTWGKLAQMTWWQWREDSVLLYVPH